LSVTTELSYLSHSFCRSLRPMGRRKLIEYSGEGVGVARHPEPDGALRAALGHRAGWERWVNQGVVADEYADAPGWN